jgi:hypothetical protein
MTPPTMRKVGMSVRNFMGTSFNVGLDKWLFFLDNLLPLLKNEPKYCVNQIASVHQVSFKPAFDLEPIKGRAAVARTRMTLLYLLDKSLRFRNILL